MTWLLACVSTRGLASNTPLEQGVVYALAFKLRCPCGQGDALVCLEGVRWKPGFVQNCRACRRPLKNEGHVAYLATRFKEFATAKEAYDHFAKEAAT